MKNVICFLSLLILPSIGQSEFCTYGIKKSSVKLEWTGFKTTKKVGVSGTFDDVKWSYKPANSLSALMKSIKFKIKTSSIDSDSWIRDRRIYKSFFKLMSEGEFIAGHGISIDEKNKTAVVEVEMNKQRTPVIFSFNAKEDNSFTMKGEIDVLKHYKMNTSYESIAKLCEKLHTGEDGVSKTWTDVELQVTGSFTKTCKK